jgi:hypothetical protein
MDYSQKMIFDLDGEVKIWIEQENSICIKAISSYGDPVELTIDQAELLQAALDTAISHINELDGENNTTISRT